MSQPVPALATLCCEQGRGTVFPDPSPTVSNWTATRAMCASEVASGLDGCCVWVRTGFVLRPVPVSVCRAGRVNTRTVVGNVSHATLLCRADYVTRLETRTKESNMCASLRVKQNPNGVIKVKGRCMSAEGGCRAFSPWCGKTAAALPGRLILVEWRRTKSVHVGTREMMNYTWSGRSQGKF